MPTPEELAELEAKAKLEHDAEWGTYVAVRPILIDGVRAFSEGHQVPVSHVERGVVSKDDVAKVANPPKVTQAAVKAATEVKG